MNFARPIKNESTDGFRSNTSAMKSVGREEEEKKKKKKRSIAEHRRASWRSWKRKVTECEKEWYEVNDLFAFLRSFYRGVSRAFVTCFGGISPHSARTGRVYGPSRHCSWCCIRTWNRERKKDIVKICSAARWDDKWNSKDLFMNRRKRVDD